MAALRLLGYGGVASGGRRRHVAVVALLVTAVAALAFVAPLPIYGWFWIPSSGSFPSDRMEASFASSVAGANPSLPKTLTPPSPYPLPQFSPSVSTPSASNSSSAEALPSDVAPSPAPVADSEALELDASSPDLNIPPLWRESDTTQDPSNAATTTVPPPVLEATSSPVGNVDAKEVETGSHPEIKASPLRREAPVWLTPTDQELIYAKREIDHAPLVTNDPDLHAPLFRNISVFKRSYELMERILRVYIYQDGEKPIFHKPELKGIYASEGWFMKLMEGNKKFVVKNPNKAHLFYLPYSARQLELALYDSRLHNMMSLSIFLKNYINMISSKYPFWNRTKGADHFFVACHDWGPYTTKLHDEFRRNTIKVLCNADASEGVFIRGKDVSLPETNIRTPKRPLRDVGGKPVSQRPILAFFAGQMHGRVRPILLRYWNGKDEDMKIYGPIPRRVSRKMSYVQHMKSSKFCICPMGYEVNSPRIVEAIYYECVPVIIADNFVLPFEEVLDWSAFSVVVAEKDIPNLKDLLLGIPQRQYITMQMNVKRLQKHFLWHAKPIKYDIFHMILHSVWLSRLNQIQQQQ